MSSQYKHTLHHEVTVAVSQASPDALPARATRAGGASSFSLSALLARSSAKRCWLRVQAAIVSAGVLGFGCGDPPASNAGATSAPAGQTAPSAAGSSGISGVPSPAGAGAAGSSAQAGAAGAGTGKLSFAADVFPKVIRARCSQCHSDGPSFGGLAYFPGPEMAYTNLVNVPAGNEEGYKCKGIGLMRVQPGDPDKSLLYLKLTAPPCGSKMPPGMFGTVTPEQVEMVRQWIVDGAAP